MILQALTRCYEDLRTRGEIAARGWAPANISYALCLDGAGGLTQVIPTLREVESRGQKKTKSGTTEKIKLALRPQVMTLPAAVKRSSGVASNFLWDNSRYLLGADQKGKPKRSRECFEAAARLHHAVLDGVDSPAAAAILAFFDSWEPDRAAEHPALAGIYDEVTGAANLVFRVDGLFAQEDEKIREAWRKYQAGRDEGERMQCLVTGEEEPIPAIHPAIKGVRGAQSTGAALVSFNAPAFCSYGHEQNLNAPVGEYASFAYTSALNYLLANRNAVRQAGDSTVVCWAEGAEPEYRDMALSVLFGGEPEGFSEDDLYSALKRLAKGLPCNGLSPDRTFYVLGLAPNSARLSVRFFLRDSFGAMMRSVNEHYGRLEIVRPSFVEQKYLSVTRLLRETVNENTRDKAPSPAMSGAVMRAILSGERYPASLLEAVMLRIRAERKITWGRAAIIKAYYLRNKNPDCPEEVLTVSLNEKSTNTAYTLGRLFAVYEAVQQDANPGINTTIKDRFFNSASAAPASIFPILGNLYQKHLRKLDIGRRIAYDRQVTELKGLLGESYPARMNLAQQGSFDLGYYHQTQKRYTKKEEQ